MTTTLNANALMGEFTPEQMPEKQYHMLPHASRSDLSLVLRSPQHYRQSKTFPEKPTPAMLLGTAIHQRVLEPGRTGVAVVPATINRRTKIGKEEYATWMEEHAGQVVLSAADALTVEEIGKAIDQCPAAKGLLLTDTVREHSFLWRDSVTGLASRCRADALCKATGIAADLKSTTDCSQFGSALYRYGYFMQAAYYLDGINATLAQQGEEPAAKAFAFVAVEKTPPYGILAGILDAEDMERGRQSYQRAQRRLQWCLENDKWPGYSAVVQGVSLPSWARRQHDESFGEV